MQAIDQQTFDLSNLKKAPKIFKEDGEINWNQGVHTIHNFIRGLSPYPGAWCHLNKNGKNVLFKLSNTQLTDISSLGKTIEVINDGILFPTKDFYLKVMEIQMEGKRKMTFKEFQAGNDIESFTMP